MLRSGMFRDIEQKVCCGFFASPSVIIAFVATEQLCRSVTRTTASDVLLVTFIGVVVVSGPSMVSVVFRLGLVIASSRRMFQVD